MAEAPDVVVPMEELPNPMHIDFSFKATNISGAIVYVGVKLVTPPEGWAGDSEMQMGSLGIGIDDYFLFDTPTRTKPATGTTEVVTLRVTYYSDAAYTSEVNHDDISYTYTYVDFTDTDTYNVVDDDTFETDLEGWTKTDEVGSSTQARDTAKARTGVASMKHYGFDSGDISYLKKSFTISNVTSAFIRVWFNLDLYNAAGAFEYILELITDAGAVSTKRTLPIAMDGQPKGGTEIEDQWLVVAARLPTNGTYEVRLRVKAETAATSDKFNYDDIRVIETKT